MTRAGKKCLVGLLLVSACGGGVAPSGDRSREASATAPADGGTCSAQLPSLTSAVGEDTAAAIRESWSASSIIPVVPPPPPPWRPNCGLKLATDRAACNAALAADTKQCDDIYWQCVAWPLVRCWAIPDCTADWNACINSAATTNRMCLNLATTLYNKCVAAGGIP